MELYRCIYVAATMKELQFTEVYNVCQRRDRLMINLWNLYAYLRLEIAPIDSIISRLDTYMFINYGDEGIVYSKTSIQQFLSMSSTLSEELGQFVKLLSSSWRDKKLHNGNQLDKRTS